MADWLARQLGPSSTVLVQQPFVLGGDLGRDELLRWHEDVIRPAYRAMVDEYFAVAPDRPISLLLFARQETYCREARRLWRSEVSAHGFHRPGIHLVMAHVESGPAVLLHELTHALMEFDYRSAPFWLAEGLAALHEQARYDGASGRLVGLPERRLGPLHSAIERDRLPTLERLVGQAHVASSSSAPLHYAHARFFCLYLQQRGLLAAVYRRRANDRPTEAQGRACASRSARQSSICEAGGSVERYTRLPGELGCENWQQLENDFRNWLRRERFLSPQNAPKP